MRKLICGVLLFCAVTASAAVNKGEVKRIYNRIVKANGLKAVPIYVVNYPIVNAYYDGEKIIVYTGLLKFVRNTDELALIVGHELGHMKWHTEQRADEYGALYAIKAGFKYCRGAQAYKRMGGGDMPIHPPGKDRYKAMNCGV